MLRPCACIPAFRECVFAPGCYKTRPLGRVAELADAPDSKSGIRKNVSVRVRPRLLSALSGSRMNARRTTRDARARDRGPLGRSLRRHTTSLPPNRCAAHRVPPRPGCSGATELRRVFPSVLGALMAFRRGLCRCGVCRCLRGALGTPSCRGGGRGGRSRPR